MKNIRTLIGVVLAIAILGGVVQVAIPRRPAGREATPLPAPTDRAPRSSRPGNMQRSVEPRLTPSPLRQRPAPSVSESRTEPVKPDPQTNNSEQKASAAGAKTQKTPGAKQGSSPAPEPLQDPAARVALAFVGADPDAETYWYAAINDPGLSAHERQDLIEDLNEDGLSDPQNPTVEDLPLILNRLQLIEAVASDAMDEVNADAFQEAYKDLVNLAIQALGQG